MGIPKVEKKTSLYGGWPLTPSIVWPGELSLECPKCGGRNITLTSEPRGLGTGPLGRHRLGDPSVDVAVCAGCGNRGYHQGQQGKVSS